MQAELPETPVALRVIGPGAEARAWETYLATVPGLTVNTGDWRLVVVVGGEPVDRWVRRLPPGTAPAQCVCLCPPEPDRIADAARTGVRAFLHSECAPHEIMDAIRAALAGRVYAPQELLPALLGAASRTTSSESAVRERIPGLANQQLRVAVLVSRGKSNCEVAAALDRSLNTVATQLKAVFRTLSVSRRAELTALHTLLEGELQRRGLAIERSEPR